MLKQPTKNEHAPTVKDVFTDESVSEVITEYVPMPSRKKEIEETKPVEPIVEKKVEEKDTQFDELVEVLDDLERSEKKAETQTPIVEKKPAQPVSKKSGSKGLLFLIILLLLLAALIFGFYTLFSRAKNAEKSALTKDNSPAFIQPTTEEVNPTPTPSLAPNPEATESGKTENEVSKKDINVRIENGTTIAGEASRWKAFLEKAGYTIVSVGNATSQNATETTIQANAKGTPFVEALITDLSEKGTAVASQTPLNKETKYDILITIGK